MELNKKTKWQKLLIGISIFITSNIFFVVAYIYYALTITKSSLGVFYSEIYLTFLYGFFFLTIFPAYYKKEINLLYKSIFHHSNDLINLGSKLIFKGFKSLKFSDFVKLFSQLYMTGASFFIIAGVFTFIAFPLSFFTTELNWWSVEKIIKSLVVLPFLLIFVSTIFLVFHRIIVLILQSFGVIKK